MGFRVQIHIYFEFSWLPNSRIIYKCLDGQVVQVSTHFIDGPRSISVTEPLGVILFLNNITDEPFKKCMCHYLFFIIF